MTTAIDTTNEAPLANGAGGPILTEAQRKLAELRAARAELQEKAEARDTLSTDEQIAIESRALAADQELDKLAAEHGRVGAKIDIVRIDDERDGRAVILRRPNMTVFRRFQDSGTNESKDLDNLVRPCVLYPSKAEFDMLVTELPFLLKRCADVCCTLAGVRKADIAGK